MADEAVNSEVVEPQHPGGREEQSVLKRFVAPFQTLRRRPA